MEECYLCYSFAVGKKNLAQMPFSLRCLQDEKYFARPTIHVRCKKFARDRESLVDEAAGLPLAIQKYGVWSWLSCLYKLTGLHVDYVHFPRYATGCV